MIIKNFYFRRSPTPTPYQLRPLYEAESPDELALVDAAGKYTNTFEYFFREIDTQSVYLCISRVQL